MAFNLTNPDNETDGGLLELDGLSFITSAKVGNFTYVFAAGGVDDGVSVYRLNANGTLTSVDNETDAGLFELDGAAGMSTAMIDGNTYLFVAGSVDDGVSVFRVNTDGSLTGTDNFTDVGDGTVTLDGAWRTATARFGGVTYLYVAGTNEDGIQRFSVSGAGRLTALGVTGDAGALELDQIRGLTSVTVGANSFVIATGQADDGVSVFQVGANGALTNTANVSDGVGGATELDGAYEVATTVVNGTTYVFVAGQADNGVSAFTLNSSGVLTHVQSIDDASGTLRLTGAQAISTVTFGATSYLLAGGSENGFSVFRIDPTAGNLLTHVHNVDDAGARELAGLAALHGATVDGSSFMLGGGDADDGFSSFGSDPTGQVWYLTQGNPTDARLARFNDDGVNPANHIDNSPTTDLGTGFPEEIAIDMPAGRYWVLAGGGDGSNSEIRVGQIGSMAAPTLVHAFDDDGLAYAIHVDPYNEFLYVSYLDIDAFGPATQGVMRASYNPLTGALSSALTFIATGTTAGINASEGGATPLFIPRDFDIDEQGNFMYFTNLSVGDGFETNRVWRLNLASPTSAAVPLVPQAQFPLTGNGSDFTTTNGFIKDVEVDVNSNRVYFSTQAEEPGDNGTGEDALWMVANASTANGTVNATKVTLVGITQNDFYPGDMTLDEVNNILYVESEHVIDGVGADDDVIHAFQLDAAGTTATLINTISPGFAGTTNIGGLFFNTLPTLSGLTSTGSAATEQGSSIVALGIAPGSNDPDNDRLSSATVQITGGSFVSNESSANDDDLGVGAGFAQSGTIAGTNITISWDQATGTLTLSGYDTHANYMAALATVRFQSTGDNPTNYGLNPQRTLTWTLSDGTPDIPTGAQNSQTSLISITAVNDAPVNVVPGSESGLEDNLFGIKGVQVGDVDANPGITDITVTLSVDFGTLTVKDTIVGGLSAADIAGNGTGTVTITATQNEINLTFADALGIGYQGNLNFFGTDVFEIVTNDGGNTGTGGGLSDTDQFNITVTAVNDAPTGTPEDRTISEDETYVFTLADFSDGFADTDDNPAPNSLNRVQVTTLASDGMLMFDADGPGGAAAVAVSLLQFISTADIAAGKFFFVPSPNENDTTDYATFDFKLEDNGGVANGGVNLSAAYAFTFDVNPVNDAPLVVGATESLAAILEDAANPPGDTVASLFGTHFDDTTDNSASSTANALAGVAVTATNATTEGVWQYFDGSSWVDITGVSTASALVLDTAASLRFLPAANFNGTAPTLVVHLIDDSAGAVTTGATADLTTAGGITQYSAGTVALGQSVTQVNDEPSGTDKTVTTNEDTDYTFTVADFGFLDGADNNDFLNVIVTTVPGTDTLELNGATVTDGQSISASDIALGLLKFVPAADANGAGYADFTFQVQDDNGTLNGGVDTDQTPNTMTIDVTSVNDAPEGTDNTVSAAEDGQHVFTVADFGLTDPDDDPDNALSAVIITTLPGNGTLALNGTAVTLGQSIAVADIVAGDLTFEPAADANGAGYDSFTFQVQDGGGVLNGGADTDQSPNTMTIDVTEVNDAPTAGDDVLSAVDEDAAAITISFASLTGNDSAGPANEAAQTLNITGVSNVVGGSAQIVGTDVVFTLEANFNGTASFDYTVEDDGTTNGAADPQTDVGSASFTVNSINDAPVGADNTVSTAEDTVYTFTAADFGFTDPDDSPADDFVSVQIGTLPGPGALELDGVAVSAGQFISITDIDAGKLKYTPGLNDFAAAYASFGFRVQDDGGTTGGGDDLDNTERFITIDVTAADDDPTVDQGIGDTIAHFDEAFSFIFAADAFDDIDGDSLTYTAEIDGGGALPAWLTFTSATREFSGTPAEADVGPLTIRVTASDGAGPVVSTVFTLDVLGDLVLFGDAHSNNLLGHHGDDTLSGRKGNDTLIGAQGRDRLDGNDGNDLLQGNGGGDKLQGADGNDTLVGGFGRDVYRGGADADTFVYDDGDINVGPPKETIRDYEMGIDTIDLSAIDANGAGPGDTAFTWLDGAKFTGVAGEATFKVVNLGVILMMDLDGDEVADLQVNILDATDIAAGDLVL